MRAINNTLTNIKNSNNNKIPIQEIQIGVEILEKSKKEFKILYETNNLKNQNKNLIKIAYFDK
jgi:hypothetical protein